MYKPANKNNGVPWHQDFISKPHEPIKHIAWIALDHITRENGALRVIPGSHKRGFLRWRRHYGETHHDRLDPTQLDERDAISVELGQGDVLIFHQLLIHSSEETNGTQLLRAYRISYTWLNNPKPPRGSPLVMCGGLPDDLEKHYPQMYRSNKVVLLIKRISKKINEIIQRM